MISDTLLKDGKNLRTLLLRGNDIGVPGLEALLLAKDGTIYQSLTLNYWKWLFRRRKGRGINYCYTLKVNIHYRPNKMQLMLRNLVPQCLDGLIYRRILWASLEDLTSQNFCDRTIRC